jgi:hypothetical protein
MGGKSAEFEFLENTYELLISLFALVVGPYADLLDVSILSYVILSTRAFVMLFLLFKLCQNFLNNPTACILSS